MVKGAALIKLNANSASDTDNRYFIGFAKPLVDGKLHILGTLPLNVSGKSAGQLFNGLKDRSLKSAKGNVSDSALTVYSQFSSAQKACH